VLIPLWNCWYFFALYSNVANVAGEGGYDAQRTTASEHPMDRYLLAKTRQYVEESTRQLDDYEVANACDTTQRFLDVLSNWYIRRSRERFWAADSSSVEDTSSVEPVETTTQAFDTLFTVLETVCRVVAPLLPLTAEEIWRGLTGGRSVHLTDWPSADDLPEDAELVAAMDQVRDVCSAGSALRKGASLRNRLPLSSLTVVVSGAERLKGFEEIVADELNVRSVRLLAADHPDAAAYDVSQRLTVNARAAGPRLGADVQTAIRASKSGDWTVSDAGVVTAGGLVLEDGEYALETVASGGEGSATGLLPGGGFVVLDTAVTPELEAEGVARDLVRAVQQARRDAGLDVSDRITLTISADASAADAARTHADLIRRETLATSLDIREAEVAQPVIELARA
jgi:isoleucyl-tRNA synthetase